MASHYKEKKDQQNTLQSIIIQLDISTFVEEEFFVQPKLTDEPDGSLLFEVTLNDDTEFLQRLMKYGANAEILEPVEYREKMREKLKKWIGLY